MWASLANRAPESARVAPPPGSPPCLTVSTSSPLSHLGHVAAVGWSPWLPTSHLRQPGVPGAPALKKDPSPSEAQSPLAAVLLHCCSASCLPVAGWDRGRWRLAWIPSIRPGAVWVLSMSAAGRSTWAEEKGRAGGSLSAAWRRHEVTLMGQGCEPRLLLAHLCGSSVWAGVGASTQHPRPSLSPRLSGLVSSRLLSEWAPSPSPFINEEAEVQEG